MKRFVPLVLVVGGVGLVLWAVVRNSPRQPVPQQAVAPTPTPPAQPAPPPAGAPPQEAAATPAAVEGEQIVYQFEDEANMREFAGIWQSRQKVLLRLAVLRAYWDNEQAGAATVNAQLQTQYSLSPAGNYVLDGDKRALIERPAEASEAPGTEGQPTEAPAGGQEGTVVHTFATEEEMQTFANLWQQRQGSGVRMAVLKSFWDEENTELTKLNSTLTETYTLDVTKNYTLDANRRVIIERAQEAPPAMAPPALTEPPPAPPANP